MQTTTKIYNEYFLKKMNRQEDFQKIKSLAMTDERVYGVGLINGCLELITPYFRNIDPNALAREYENKLNIYGIISEGYYIESIIYNLAKSEEDTYDAVFNYEITLFERDIPLEDILDVEKSEEMDEIISEILSQYDDCYDEDEYTFEDDFDGIKEEIIQMIHEQEKSFPKIKLEGYNISLNPFVMSSLSECIVENPIELLIGIVAEARERTGENGVVALINETTKAEEQKYISVSDELASNAINYILRQIVFYFYKEDLKKSSITPVQAYDIVTNNDI